MRRFRCSDKKWSVTFQRRDSSSKQGITHLAYDVNHNDVKCDKNKCFFRIIC